MVERTTPRVLVADDQPAILDALGLLLKDAGFQAEPVSSVQDVRERLNREPFDLLLMDLNYQRDTTSGREGLALLDEVHERHPLLPVIVMTGWGGIETAVEAMRRGARTFVHKPWDNSSLTQMVRREVDEGRALRVADARASREQADARSVQRAFLPSTLPDVKGCAIAAIWQPAADFGGDCYDVLSLGDDRAAISIADVAGKGLPAALLMSSLQASSRAFVAHDPTPQTLVGSINRSLCANIHLDRFVTMCYGVLDTGARTLTFTNAGHNPPVLMHADGTVERLTTGGLVLGVFDNVSYEQRTVAVQPGDRLVLFTDGIVEAENADGLDFGDSSLVAAIARHLQQPAQRLATMLFEEVRRFAEDGLRDDATLIVVAID